MSNEKKKGIVINQILIMTLSIFCVLIFASSIYIGKNNNVGLKNKYEKGNLICIPKTAKVKLYKIEEKRTEELELEYYITGVVASEVPANFDIEAIKAQAVAARTFYINKRNNPCNEALQHNAEICDTVGCQVYMDKDDIMAKWSKEDAEKNWNKIRDAVIATKGEIIVYDGKAIEYPQYFAISHGKTEDSMDVLNINVPYLKSVDSKGEEIAPKYKSLKEIQVDEFIEKLNEKIPSCNLKKENIQNQVCVESYTKSGSVDQIKLADISIKGLEFRKIFNLNSSCFTINIRNDIVSIACTGYGHGLGMSQWGANYMAKKGSLYEDILKHYYNGVQIVKLEYK